jgi:hypothetical protein
MTALVAMAKTSPSHITGLNFWGLSFIAKTMPPSTPAFAEPAGVYRSKREEESISTSSQNPKPKTLARTATKRTKPEFPLAHVNSENIAASIPMTVA